MILPKIKVLRSHGKQYIPDLDAVELTEEFRGRPHLTETPDTTDLERAAAICPTGALTTAPLSLDLGRCLFCGECARTAPRNIRFTNDYRIGSPTREGLVVRPGDKCVRFDPAAVRPEIGRYFGRSLQLREVCAGARRRAVAPGTGSPWVFRCVHKLGEILLKEVVNDPTGPKQLSEVVRQHLLLGATSEWVATTGRGCAKLPYPALHIGGSIGAQHGRRLLRSRAGKCFKNFSHGCRKACGL